MAESKEETSALQDPGQIFITAEDKKRSTNIQRKLVISALWLSVVSMYDITEAYSMLHHLIWDNFYDDAERF